MAKTDWEEINKCASEYNKLDYQDGLIRLCLNALIELKEQSDLCKNKLIQLAQIILKEN